MIAELEKELAIAEDKAGRQRRYFDALELWERIRERTGQLQRKEKWPLDLAQAVKFNLVSQIFKSIYIKEPEGGSPRDANNHKTEMDLSFEFR